MDKQTNGQKGKQTDKELVDGQTDGRTDRQMNGPTNRQDRQTQSF